MKQFTKADLKPGMIVKLRRGEYAMVYAFNGALTLVSDVGWGGINNYDRDLSNLIFDSLDIIEVKKVTYPRYFRPKHWHEAPTIWERKEIPELTEVEKGILESVIRYDKAAQWIARDESGALCVYYAEPTKKGNTWRAQSCDYHDFKFFKHLFQFVKWEDDEPWYILDLLEGDSE